MSCRRRRELCRSTKATRSFTPSTCAATGKRRRAILRDSEKIIAGSLDEKNKRGNRTRLLSLAPGTFSTAPFVHEYWEEVFLLSGDLIVGNDAAGKGGEQFRDYTYAVRPPGVHHGPFKSETAACREMHYYD